jgi:hypothetical protein
MTDSTHFYHPDHLDASFLHDQLKVKIVYNLTSGEFHCGWSAIRQVIYVVDITK